MYTTLFTCLKVLSVHDSTTLTGVVGEIWLSVKKKLGMPVYFKQTIKDQQRNICTTHKTCLQDKLNSTSWSGGPDQWDYSILTNSKYRPKMWFLCFFGSSRGPGGALRRADVWHPWARLRPYRKFNNVSPYCAKSFHNLSYFSVCMKSFLCHDSKNFRTHYCSLNLLPKPLFSRNG